MGKTKPIREATIFIGLTLGVSYFVFWGPLAVFKVPTVSFVDSSTGPVWAIILFVLGGFVPSGVALFLTWRNEGKAGLAELGRRIVKFNLGWQWYLAVLGVVIVGAIGQLLLMRILGNGFDYSYFTRQIGSLIPLLILGPLSEEIGWRGYALDRLQTKWSAFISSMIVGVVWGFWHLPLFFMVGTSQNVLNIPFPSFLSSVMALSVLYTWLHNNTEGSIWTAVLFHWLYTYAAQVIASGVTRTALYNWLEFLPYAILAVIAVVVWNPERMANKSRR